MRSSTRIGLVLAPDDDAVTGAEPDAPLRERWERIVAKRERGAKAPPLPFGGARDVIVLPRLETIADDAAFEREVRAVAPGLAP
jgi:hypothetical protein